MVNRKRREHDARLWLAVLVEGAPHAQLAGRQIVGIQTCLGNDVLQGRGGHHAVDRDVASVGIGIEKVAHGSNCFADLLFVKQFSGGRCAG